MPFNDDAARYAIESILKYRSDTVEKVRQRNSLTE